MIVSEITSRVKYQFGDESGVQIDDNTIIRWLNDALREFAFQNKLFQTKATVATVANQQAYAFPADLLRLHSIKVDYVNLKEMTLIEVDEYIVNSTDPGYTSDNAELYWIYGEEFHIYPIPSGIHQLQVYYTRVPTDLVAIGDTLPVAEEYRARLVEYCLTQAYELDENFKAAQIKDEQYRAGLVAMRDAQQNVRDSVYPQINYISDWSSSSAW